MDSRTLSEVFHKTKNARGDRRKGEIHRNEYWYHCQEHPDSRLTHPQSCPTSGGHLTPVRA